ncbi:MAG: undecaprenyl-phosphate glucose phosphotransferase [uncultured bacterium]|nr:MAG: undecaprenyl-phosphate glucose phosphotransferase [uncultured bacterium]
MKKSELAFGVIQVPVDYIMIVGAAFLTYYLRFKTDLAGDAPLLFDLRQYTYVVLIVGLVWLVFFSIAGFYNLRRSQRLVDELYRAFLGVSAGTMAIIIFIFLRKELFFSSRFIIIATWIFAVIFVTLGRFIVRRIQVALYKKGIGVNRVVVVGKDRASGIIVNDLSSSSKKGYMVLKVFASPNSLQETRKLLEEFEKLNEKYQMDQIIQTDPKISRGSVVRLINFADDKKIIFKYAPDLFQTEATNIEVRPVAGIPLVELKRTPLDGWGRVAKRVMDIIGSLLLIIFSSPIMISEAVAVKLGSKGPIFFKIKRIGQNGEPFLYFKFRSMIDGAEKLRYDPSFRRKVEDLRKGSPMVKYKDDPRITRVGKFIRQTSIDEFPEFFNVFIGKMSLVGPRPHEVEEVAKYKKHHRKVLTLKPGITGLPQISGRSDLDFEEEVRLDTYYIENWSFKLDLYILLKTPFILLKKRRAL